MSQEEILIAAEGDIADPGSKGLSVSIEGTKLELFIVKKNASIAVYENSCPHTSGPLDWTPNQFLDLDNNYIMCANHGALFEIDNGLCIYGPCKAQSLKKLAFVVKKNNIYLLL